MIRRFFISGRLWLAVFATSGCILVYSVLTLNGQSAVRHKRPKAKKLPPTRHEDLVMNKTLPVTLPSVDDVLLNLPSDFPLAGGMVKPRPGVKAGNARANATVVIGIPSVKRSGVDYLPGTVDSLLTQMSPEEKLQTVIVIYIGEIDAENVGNRMKDLQARFPGEMANGTLEVISPPKTLYPNWKESVQASFGDTLQRSIWRSKQNLDQVFLMMYIYHLKSKYYLTMEDDVIATRSYMAKLLQTVERWNNPQWVYFSFCSLGAIGKLFRRKTLPSYASFLHTFWDAKPLDWLQADFLRSRICSYDESDKTCSVRMKAVTPSSSPSLFQHVGRVSSLTGKIQGLRDKSFRN